MIAQALQFLALIACGAARPLSLALDAETESLSDIASVPPSRPRSARDGGAAPSQPLRQEPAPSHQPLGAGSLVSVKSKQKENVQ